MPVLRMPVEGWSLAGSVAQFGWRGAVDRREDEVRYYITAHDDDGEPFAARLVQDDDGLRVHSDTKLSRSAVFQVARMLSIAWPRDDAGFPAIGQRDPVVERLQERYPGVRPIGSPSVFEAAVQGVLAFGLPGRIAGQVWARIADVAGDRAVIDGGQLSVFPAPGRLLDPQALAQVRGMNGDRGLIRWKRARVAELARLALEGELDGAMLRAWDGELAAAHLERVAGLAPNQAQLVLVRGAHHPDVLLSGAPQVVEALERAYRLQPGDVEGAASIAEVWSPYRSWVSVLLFCAAEDDAGADDGDDPFEGLHVAD
jgi:3-methyladenine DNA glycosylase/8-oxoguanine DNA glycosylase